MNRHIEDSILPTRRELGIGIVGFGVLQAGLVGGGDTQQKMEFMTKMVPPATLQNFNDNLSQSDRLKEIAGQRNITLAQLAIAWVLSREDDILALVGSRTAGQAETTAKALEIELTEEELYRIEQVIPKEKALSNFVTEIPLNENGTFAS